jgi:cytochrome P450
VDLSEVDLLDSAIFASERDHDVFRLLRDRSPVFWNPEPDGPGFWSLTRYGDVAAASRDHRRLGSEEGTQIASRRAEGELHSIHNMDEPGHTEMRKLIADQFAPRAVLRWRPRIQEIIDSLLDEMVERGECEFVEHAASRLPLLVLAELLGVPKPDAPLLLQWTNEMVTPDAGPLHAGEAQVLARAQLFDYFHHLVKERRHHPADDLVTLLARSCVGGRPLTEHEMDPYFLLLVVAGNETTRNLVSGGLWGLASTSGALERLRGCPDLLDTSVEEMLRWVSPVINMRRTAACDIEWHGTAIPAGDKVVLWFGSANRDERVFPDPDQFKLDRRPNNHLAFGWGNHFCLGAHLARLEVKLFFAELLRRNLVVEVTEPPVRVMSNWFRGIKKLPVRVTEVVAA